jgi:hypothetical protein
VRAIVVTEACHQRMPLERLLHDSALNTRPPSMHEAHFPQTGCVRFVHVLVDNRRDVAGLEGVKVELRFDRYAVDVGVIDSQSASYLLTSASLS